MKGGDTWELLLKGESPDHVRDRLSDLGNITNVLVETKDGGFIRAGFFIPADDEIQNKGERIFDWAVSSNFKILEMNRKKLSIEDIFVKLTGEEKKIETQEGGE
jgi:ABC-2 type transport system ATP-binding protein